VSSNTRSPRIRIHPLLRKSCLPMKRVGLRNKSISGYVYVPPTLFPPSRSIQFQNKRRRTRKLGRNAAGYDIYDHAAPSLEDVMHQLTTPGPGDLEDFDEDYSDDSGVEEVTYELVYESTSDDAVSSFFVISSSERA
jgi:hypothetical protein